MNYFSVWPFFACLAVICAAVATPLFRLADAPTTDKGKRNPGLDGLRGFLALAVVFHHGAIYHGYLLTGIWTVPPSSFYTGLGQGGVSIFFMVTGYLFWGKVITEQFRSGVNWPALYIGRIFRIAPVYLLAVCSMLVIVGFETDWTLLQPVSTVAKEVTNWLALGIRPRYDVNSFRDTDLLLAGVTWSLKFEWAFYGALFILALVLAAVCRLLPARRKLFTWLLPGFVLAACLIKSPFPNQPNRSICCALFSVGMLAAACGPFRLGPDWLRSSAVLAFVAIALVGFPSSYHAGPVLLLGAAFTLIASGCTVFGTTTSRPAMRLGDISYGIYLLQGLALAAAFRPASLRVLALADPYYHWMLLLSAALVLVGAATIVHVIVERPGITLGRRIARRVVRT
jgi:peptidoglycan/LPS O-acetylase OafA/YrhL